METEVSVENENKIYSGGLKPGWDNEAGYDRLRFVDLKTNQSIASVSNIIDKGLNDLANSNNSRLDLRLKVVNDFSMSGLQTKFPMADVSVRSDNENSSSFLTIGINNEGRTLANEKFLEVQKRVAEKIIENEARLCDFKSHVEGEMEKISELDLRFETLAENFSVDEILKYWGPMFDWSKKDVSDLLENISDQRILGLRNESNKLVACMLMADGESTEWAVCPSLQGNGLIVPLLLRSHAERIREGGEAVDIHAHLRHDRSVSAGMKAGMKIDHSFGTPNLLTNHVDVDGELTHFVEGKVDTSLFTPEVLQLILNK